ncbi:MAG: TolC family protein, partial [Myxococcota bacterium]
FNYVRYAEIRERRQTLRQLSLQLGSVELAIDSRVRSALHQSSASRAAVSLSEEAAEAARQNLSLVTDRYRKGTVDVVRLIDAQTESFQAGLNAANALYDFLGDFVEVERAVGAFQFMKNQEQRDDFVRRVQAFAASKSPRSRSRD